MPLDWLNSSLDTSVSELIARKKRAKAIEVLRSQLQSKAAPGVNVRLQLVDLLIQAGRGLEAVPVLLGLADELARDGFVAKAVAVLKRIDKIEPGRSDVESRLTGLVALQRTVSRGTRLPAKLQEWGIEEISDEPLPDTFLDAPVPEVVAPVSAATPAPPPAPTVPELTLGELGAWPASTTEPEVWVPPSKTQWVEWVPPRPEASTPAELISPFDAVPTTASAPEPAASGPAGEALTEVLLDPAPARLEEPLASPAEPAPAPRRDPATAESGVAGRIRGAFRRFLASLPGTASEGSAPVPAAADVVPALTMPNGIGDEAVAPLSETGQAAEESAESEAASLTATASDAPAVEPEPVREPTAPAVELEPARDPTPAVVSTETEPDAEPAPAVGSAELEPEPVPTPVVVGEAAEVAALPPEPEPEPVPLVARPPLESEAEPLAEIPLEPPVPEAAVPRAEPVSAPEAGEPASVSLLEFELEAASEVEAGPFGESEGSVPAAATLPDLRDSDSEGVDDVSDELFQEQLLDIVEDVLRRPTSPVVEAAGAPVARTQVLDFAQRLVASPLFGTLSDDELLAVVQGLRLHTCDAGDLVVSEGEPGHSLFIVAAGAVKVFVANPTGHNFPVATLGEGEFFGEISSLSGRPRTATIVAAGPTELLELDKLTLDAIAATHPRVCDVLESYYIQRASSPEAAAIRAVAPSEADAHKKAIEVLEAHFGENRWDPRMRLRLADVLLKAGKHDDALPILIGLADELARGGYPEKAVAILKRVEQVQRGQVEEVNLAPLARPRGSAPKPAKPPAPAPASPAPVPDRRSRPATDTFFQGWLVEVVRDTVTRLQGPQAASTGGGVRGYGPGLMASPLFDDFSEDELLAFIQGLRLLSFEPGDMVVTEGEPGSSLFILTTGAVKVFVRNPLGHNVPISFLREGAFFGEISTLSGRPRSATVTAAAACELLEMDRQTLAEISRIHPRIAQVLDDYSQARSNDPSALEVRGAGASDVG